MRPTDEVGEQLASWGKVARIETRGRVTGREASAAVGFVAETDGSLLVAAGSPEADWARNLQVDPGAIVSVEGDAWPVVAEALVGAEANRAVVALILKYGTPAERLGRGPAFRLRRTPTGQAGR